ncbi:hypothetical protein HUW48_21820 [Adhaeribacter radiodurans]|uniref:Rieske domain-containing protein n=1 Tax=Adhaeribacter radiodurans TaxID=2745197 RepID=A0A7L7LG52_9BACT|nr:hypothetical protein HUW48_21820 [Adhaeribacter radiodurans]
MSACDETTDNPIIPNVLVNEQINLTNIQYNSLRRDNGYVYLKSGVKGIILLHKTGDTYLAFERNCPYRPFDECAQVSMDPSGFFMADSCCQSVFDLNGFVTGGPSPYPLKQYSTSLTGNLLYINN